jgi:hypothetical protein
MAVMTMTTTLPALPFAKPERRTEPYADVLARLSARSVTKHFDAHADVEWDHPDNRIEQDDPRFEVTPGDPLEATDWYRTLPQAARARLGLHLTVSRMRTGIQFENILSKGLLEFAMMRPNGSPEFRYAMHEIIEEGQHSLMFQEFINRSGLDPNGLGGIELAVARRVPAMGRRFPERFFLHVLAGEAPIDHVQKTLLASSRAPHPLLKRIMQIHITEEARHICFASRFLAETFPRLGAYRAAALRVAAPFVVGATMMQMMRLPPDVVSRHAVPRDVVREIQRGRSFREQVISSVRPVHALCLKLGIITPRTEFVWNWLGLASGGARAD